MFRFLFFDNDGILVDTEHLVGRATDEVLKEMGYIGDGIALYKEYSMQKGISLWPTVQKQLGFSDKKIEFYHQKRNDLYSQYLQEGENLLIPGVLDVLQKLHNKIPLAIVTSSNKHHFDLIHQKTGILQYFEFILTREDFIHSKPHPEPYLTAFARVQKSISDLQPEECLVLEDSERGVVSAKEAGLTCFAIPTDFTSMMDFSRADKVLGSIEEVLQE